MKSKMKLCFLLLVLIFVSVISSVTNAAVVSQEVSSQFIRSSPRQEDRQETKSSKSSVLKEFRKFALLTTGKQVKLYPLSDDNQPSKSHFLIKILDQRFYRERSRYGATTNRGNTTSTRNESILPSRPDGTIKKSARLSIIPTTDQLDDDGDFIGKTGGSDFWISDLNYFFDKRHCSLFRSPAKSDECLVIIYLDTMSQQIGYAAIDLRLASKALNGHQTLWARQIGYVDVSQNGKFLPPSTTELAFDRVHRVLYANLYASKASEPVILKLDLSGLTSDLRMDRMNPCRGQKRLTNLNVDFGDWLFYADISQESEQPLKMRSIIGAVDVGSIPSNWNPLRQHAIVAEGELDKVQRFGVSGPAPDSTSRRMYWLTEHNELKSCNFIGGDIRVVNQLPVRPIIKEPGRTEIVRGTFYFSDSKRRLFYHRLPSHSQSYGLQLLLIEDRLENFRIGSMASPLACLNSSGQGVGENSTDNDPLVTQRCSPSSLQSIARDLAVSLVGDEYAILRDRSANDCLDRQIIEILLMPAALLGLILIYLVKRKYYKPALLAQKQVTKDKYPV